MTRSAQFEAKLETARAASLERQHLQTRLQDLFIALAEASLYTERLPDDKMDSLIAIFDHGIDPDPAFSGRLLARIYLDETRNLALALWPLQKEERNIPWRKEILLSQVDDFQFHLLGKKTEAGEKFAWYTSWPKKRQETPSMIRLRVRQKNDTLAFAFFPANPEPLVTYP